MFDGLQMNLGNLFRTSDAKTRSLSPENVTGEKGKGGMCELENGSARQAARDLGKTWKVNPYFVVAPGETITLADVAGPGCIQHIWMTPTGKWRSTILRMYWDNAKRPSVECPLGDFFASGWEEYAPLSSLAVCVNPGRAFNCYWPMPFREHCRITMENRSEEPMTIYYQIDYTLTELPEDTAYFHAQFRRVNPLPYKQVYPILDGVKGKGQYVGTYLAWGVNSSGWWGEGEIKFYLDGDTPLSAAPVRRTISAALTILKTRNSISMNPIVRLMQAFPMFPSRMACTKASSGSVCIAGISWTPFALNRI